MSAVVRLTGHRCGERGGCGHGLVSIEPAAALRDDLRQLSEPKWFATANGANQANEVIDLDIPELGEVVTPM